MSQLVLAGQTIRIVNTFYDFMGEPVDPEVIKFKVYDFRYKIIEEKNLGDGNKLGDGTYFYDFIPSEINKKYIVEFYGEVTGNPTFDRITLITTFVKE